MRKRFSQNQISLPSRMSISVTETLMLRRCSRLQWPNVLIQVSTITATSVAIALPLVSMSPDIIF